MEYLGVEIAFLGIFLGKQVSLTQLAKTPRNRDAGTPTREKIRNGAPELRYISDYFCFRGFLGITMRSSKVANFSSHRNSYSTPQ